MDEARLLYHIVLTIHNSRISRRMLKYKVYKKPAKYLSLKQEIMLTHMFKATILELKLKCYAYNVCRDHVHLVIQCQADDLTETTRKLKGKTVYLYNQATGNSGPFG